MPRPKPGEKWREVGVGLPFTVLSVGRLRAYVRDVDGTKRIVPLERFNPGLPILVKIP